MNNEAIRFSVIVPVYNIEKFLPECIDSIIEQSYDNLEIILVDDGSTDSSGKICDEYETHDNRIKVVHKRNGGLISARKAGVQVASGEYISFVDGDDWVDKDFFERLGECINGAGNFADIIMFGCIEEYGEWQKKLTNRISLGLYEGAALAALQKELLMGDVFFEWNILPHLCDKFLKKDLIQESLGHVPEIISYGEDVANTYPCILNAESIYVLDFTPYHYRQREGSIVKGTQELADDNFIQLHRVLKETFYKNGIDYTQLKYYMFFVLCLKAYSRIESNMVLFPFTKVKEGSKVFVYGAGGFGKVIRQHIERSDKLELAGWSDKNWLYYQSRGLEVIPPKDISQRTFDHLVIAVLNEKVANEIKIELKNYGIDEEKIDYVQRSVIDRHELPEWIK